MIRAMEAFETRFCSRTRISPSLPSSFDLLRAPLGRPSACRVLSLPPNPLWRVLHQIALISAREYEWIRTSMTIEHS